MQIEQDSFELVGEAVAFLFELVDLFGEGFEQAVLDFDAPAQGEDILLQLDVLDGHWGRIGGELSGLHGVSP